MLQSSIEKKMCVFIRSSIGKSPGRGHAEASIPFQVTEWKRRQVVSAACCSQTWGTTCLGHAEGEGSTRKEGNDRIKMEEGGRGRHLESCHIDSQEKCLRSLPSHVDGPRRGNFATRYWLTVTYHSITSGHCHSAWIIEVQTVLSLRVAQATGCVFPAMPGVCTACRGVS